MGSGNAELPASRGLALSHRQPAPPPEGLFSWVRLATPSATRIENNGDNRVRTGDPLLAKQVLYQLSYVPKGNITGTIRRTTDGPDTRLEQTLWWAREDLNLRPHAYQACALTN